MNTLGAIIGDVCGSTYEWNNETNPDKIQLFNVGSHFTDDTICTIAVMDWLNERNAANSESDKAHFLIHKLLTWCNKYPKSCYGPKFRKWLETEGSKPIGSFGNGSAMRVSPCGFAAKTIEEAIVLADLSAVVTHDHPEGRKGAQATAAAIYLARAGYNQEEIRDEIEKRFDYDLHTPLYERSKHKFDATCQVTVPEAFMAFLNCNSYAETLLDAIAIGGDSDTIAAIAGSIAGAYFGIPSYFTEHAMCLLPQ